MSFDLVTLLALDSPVIRRSKFKERRKEWVNNILTKKSKCSEFLLYNDLQDSEEHHFSYFRMHKNTFQYILEKVQHHVVKYSNFRENVSPSEHLVITLRYLVTGSSFKSLGYSFRLSDVTVGKIVHEMYLVIWEKLAKEHMPFPTAEDVDCIASKFWNKWKFPNCVGCINGKHIRLKCPKQSGSMYYNYKKFFSIVLQAVVGANYKFICIDVGACGKQSDSGVFGNSQLFRELEPGGLLTNQEKYLPGSDIAVPHVLIGDGGFPIKTYLVRPFPLKNLTPKKEIYNKRLSRARQVVECAFGIIANKWRILLKPIELSPKKAENIVKCICLLHKIILEKEHMPEIGCIAFSESSNPFVHGSLSMSFNRSTNKANAVREKFKTFFAANPL